MNKEPKLRKGQKCWLCKKEIKRNFCYNGHYWHLRCKNRDSARRIKEAIKKI